MLNLTAAIICTSVGVFIVKDIPTLGLINIALGILNLYIFFISLHTNNIGDIK